jgi:hypothetical protein
MDVTSIFGGVFIPLSEDKERVDPPDIQLRNAMYEVGIDPPDHIEFVGKIIRFGHHKSCWYVAYSDDICAGAFGDWRSGVDSTWRQDIGRSLSDDEVKEYSRRVTIIKQQRDAEEKVKHAEVAGECQALFSEASTVESHPYLAKKQVGTHCAKIASDGRLIIPLYNKKGVIQSLQYIDDIGNKRFYPGGKASGNFGVIGKLKSTIYLVEGFATAATVHEVTGELCIVAFSANNLVAVAKVIKEVFADSNIVVIGDNDASGVGQKAAIAAAKAIGCEFIIPPDEGDANDFVNAGGDLNVLLNKDSWLVQVDDFCDSNELVDWLITGYLQHNALVMVHGPSGSGKTFIVLDMALHLASGMNSWNNRNVAPCSVVYLAGEGHKGLKNRILAWKHHYGVADLSMWVSKSGCDLDVAAELVKVINGIARLPIKPGLVVIDTLHRFMSGDENSSQDARKILDACAKIQSTFNCTVLLVHHSGHSTLKRGRGSSAWRGALDIEFSVEANEGDPIVLKQIKNKDSECATDFLFNLVREIVPGCIDVYGDQVYSVVVESVEEANKPIQQPVSKHSERLKTLERAWLGGNCAVINGSPYITKSELQSVLKGDGNSDSTVSSYVKPSHKNGTIFPLLNGGEIIAHGEGWLLVNKSYIRAWMLMRGKK